MLKTKIIKTIFLLSCLSFYSSNNVFAASILPQAESSAEDGIFSLNSLETLFTDADNIYNFTDFSILSSGILNINQNEAVFIYSQQSITINGDIFSSSSDLNFIAPQITISGSINTQNNISFYGTELILSGPGSSISSDNLDATITSGTIITSGSGTFELNPISTTPITTSGTINITPVPLPAAIWFFLSGVGGLLLIRRRDAL